MVVDNNSIPFDNGLTIYIVFQVIFMICILKCSKVYKNCSKTLLSFHGMYLILPDDLRPLCFTSSFWLRVGSKKKEGIRSITLFEEENMEHDWGLSSMKLTIL